MSLEGELHMRQLNMKMKKQKQTFGGAGLRSAPKEKRPIDTKAAMHLTLKARVSILRLPKTIKVVNDEIERICKKYDFTLYKYSNNFNHLHLLIRLTNRYRWQAFIRELTGRIAHLLRDLVKVCGTFWLGRPFTRIIKGWGKNYARVKEYIYLNILGADKKLSREQARLFITLQEFFGSP